MKHANEKGAGSTFSGWSGTSQGKHGYFSPCAEHQASDGRAVRHARHECTCLLSYDACPRVVDGVMEVPQQHSRLTSMSV